VVDREQRGKMVMRTTNIEHCCLSAAKVTCGMTQQTLTSMSGSTDYSVRRKFPTSQPPDFVLATPPST